MLILALTGSIGMGKSTTAAIFAAHGVPVHDSDACVHGLYSGPASEAIELRFPGTTAAGAVDRAKLAAKVLGDPAAIADLEAIIHPMVGAEREAWIDRARAKGLRGVLLDIPLLFESGMERRADVILVVSANSVVQKQRVLARPGMTEEKFRHIMQRQTPNAEKCRRAHYVVATDLGFPIAKRQVADFLRAVALV